MLFSTSARSLPQRFCLLLTSFLQKPGLAFANALPEEKIQAAFDEQIRAIQVTLGVDVLRSKSPEMVRKETWIPARRDRRTT